MKTSEYGEGNDYELAKDLMKIKETISAQN